MRVDIDSQLSSISAFATDLKLHTVYPEISEQIKPLNCLQLVGQAAEFKFKSKFKLLHCLQVIWQSPLKAVPEDNRRLWLQIQWPSTCGRAPALLGRVRWAGTNTGRFWVGGISGRQLPARLRETCYHSCDTDSVQIPVWSYSLQPLGHFAWNWARQCTYAFILLSSL